MSISEKISKIEQLRAQIPVLEEKLNKNKAAKSAAESRALTYTSHLSAMREAPKLKRWGIICLAVSFLLIVVEIMALLEIGIEGYGNFELIDLVIIAVPLFLGITRMKKARDACAYGSEQELEAQRNAAHAEIARYDSWAARLEAAKNAGKYTGRDWDLSKFYATPENVAAMENDFEDLLIALKYTDDTQFIINCWLSANEIKRTTATFGKDKLTMEAYDRGTRRMKESGSWKLEVALIAMGVLSVELLNIALSGGQGKGTTFDELMEKSDVRKPANADEDALFALTREVSRKLAFEVGYALKKLRT